MKIKNLTLSLALSSVLLSGCAHEFTSELWDRALQYDYEDTWQALGSDKIYAFGVSKPNSSSLPPDRLLLLGEQFTYVVNKPINVEQRENQPKLLAALRATELSKPFSLGYSAWIKQEAYIQVGLSENKEDFTAATSPLSRRQTFPDEACLSYSITPKQPEKIRQQETQKLKDLGFTLERSESNGTQHYANCYGRINGKIYRNSESIAAEYRFKTGVPVKLGLLDYQTVVNPGGILTGIALTPAAVLADIFILPLLSGFAIH
ncbi:MAG: hypothetical protein Q4E16_05920 [Neisseria sp.]|nr:hypothetical protein [Neisseria sp.]